MNISYADLPSFILGWQDGLHWYEEIEVWSKQYEKRCMLPDALNKNTADETTALLLYDVPASTLPVGRAVVSALMDDRLRKAMMYPPPPAWVQTSVEAGLNLRKLLLRHLALPRPCFLQHSIISDQAASGGRYHRTEYESEPWYVESNIRNRWGLQASFKWMAGRPIPGPAFRPEGYLIEEVGPQSLEGLGRKEVEATKEKLMNAGRSGCPFATLSN